MHVVLLSPWGALVGLLGLVPLATRWLGERRARLTAEALSLPRPHGLPLVSAGAVLAVSLLLALAAAQPVLRTKQPRRVRTGTEAYVVLDTSRSMLASAGPGRPTRFDRAVAEAARIRASLADVPTGLASFTDRVLPHLFPTSDLDAFSSTLARSIGIDRPPPIDQDVTVTTFDALVELVNGNFFRRETRTRLVVLLTDAVSRDYPEAPLRHAFRSGQGIRSLIVHVGNPSEGIYRGGRLEAGFRPDPRSEEAARRLAAQLGGREYEEGRPAAVVAGARALLGPATLASAGFRPGGFALAPYAVVAAGLVLLALLAGTPLGVKLLWELSFRRRRARGVLPHARLSPRS